MRRIIPIFKNKNYVKKIHTVMKIQFQNKHTHPKIFFLNKRMIVNL